MHAHKIANDSDALAFIIAGVATFTLRNPETGNRFTYRVRVRDEGPAFIDVLTGSNNEGDFERLGLIFDGARFVVPRSWRISADAPSAMAFRWVWSNLIRGRELRGVEVWHEGRCGRCNRKLTVPESIETGLGPVCAEKAAA